MNSQRVNRYFAVEFGRIIFKINLMLRKLHSYKKAPGTGAKILQNTICVIFHLPRWIKELLPDAR